MARQRDRALRLEHGSKTRIAGGTDGGDHDRPVALLRLVIEHVLKFGESERRPVPLGHHHRPFDHHGCVAGRAHGPVDAERKEAVAKLGGIVAQLHMLRERLAMPSRKVSHLALLGAGAW